MKNRLPIILNLLLIAVALATIVYGINMLVNLRSSLSSLKQERPNLEFLLLKDLTLSVNKMEDQAIAYQYDPDSIHIQNIDSIYFQSIVLVDSLKKLNETDPLLYFSSDSLTEKFTTYHDQLMLLCTNSAYDLNLPFGKIEDFVQRQLQFEKEKRDSIRNLVKKSTPDTVVQAARAEEEPVEEETEKVGFFKRLFGGGKKKNDIAKNQREDQNEELALNIDTLELFSDTLFLVDENIDKASMRKEQSIDQIESIIDSLENQFMVQQSFFSKKELSLSKNILNTQYSILELLSRIESRELEKSQKEATKAQESQIQTNRQVSKFAFIVGLVLIFTVIGLLIFLYKNNRYQKMLEKARWRAEDYAQTKQLFVAKMSHEIRTPMNAILGFSEQLKRTRLDGEQTEYLDIINQSSDHLLRLLNDILDISKFQNKAITLESTSFDLEKLVVDSFRILQSKAKEKNLEYNLNTKNIKVRQVYGDPLRIRQIILNLLSNSIKFTSEGKIDLVVQSKKINDTEEVDLRIIVRDTGIGIPKDKQVKVFSAFEQLTNEEMSSGAGLGLPIIKHIVDLYKGKIKIKSEINEGTIFGVTLPLKVAQSIDEEVDVANVTTKVDFSKLKVLIADDEKFNRRLLFQILKSHDIIPALALDGQIALQMLSKNDFDVAFLDLNMPILNGAEVVEQSRKLKENKTKFVAVTATISMDQQIENLFDEVITKPFKEDDVFRVLSGFYTKSDNSPSISINALSDIGDQKFVSEMLNDFVSNTEKSLNTFYSLSEDGDYKKAFELLHKIKGPAKHLEARSFVKTIVAIEKSGKGKDKLNEEEIIKLNEEFNKLKSSINNYLSLDEHR